MTRLPDLPCAHCGKLLWRTKTSLPKGQAMCHVCRRAGRSFKHGTATAVRSGCCCAECKAYDSNRNRKYLERYRAEHGENPSTTVNRKFRDEHGFWPQSGSSNWIDPNVRFSLYERDSWACHLCGGDIDREAHWNENFAPSLDHLLPRSRGGSDDPDNLKTAHRVCNSIRRDAPLVI